MREYHKIETVFNRDIEGSKQLIPGSYRSKTAEFLKDAPWVFTEKIDGTNVRIFWDGHKVSFAGRTERSDLPVVLFEYLQKQFGTSETEEVFEQLFGEREVILFGEGYGGKIQGAGLSYRPDVSFILFDVLIGDNWQEREWVEKTAEAFGVGVVPVVLTGTLADGIRYVASHPRSEVGETAYMEGVVGRPAVELRDRCGSRLIVKIKWKDFRPLVEAAERANGN